MQGRKGVLTLLALSLAIVIAVLSAAAFYYYRNGEVLWQIVSEKCVPGMRQYGDPTPCQNVNLRQGYVVFKDIKGPLHYLLLPTAKITGMESPALLDPATPNLFFAAWQWRTLLIAQDKPINDRAFALAINAQYGRSQNQLHIHISCLRPEVRQQLDTEAAELNEAWQSLTLHGHRYLVRALSAAQVAQSSAFIRLATEVPGARNNMGQYGLALAALPDGRLALMALRRNWLMLNGGSAGELQDYTCQLLSSQEA